MKRFVHPLLGALIASAALTQAQLPTLSVSADPTNEGLIGLLVTFNLDQPAEGGERVFFDLIPGTATTEDYIPFDVGIIDFNEGDTSQSFFVTMIDDAVPEPDEIFSLVVSNPTGLNIPSEPFTLTILNDDVSTNGVASFVLPSFFSDGMVLQQEKGAKIWGFALPDTQVDVQFAGRSWQTSTSSAGRFEVTLDNLAASFQGQPLTIDVGDDSTTINDVLVGEVWLGAGQSNMEYRFSFIPSPENDNEVATANDPLIRVYVPTEQARDVPQSNIQGDWLQATSGDMPDMPTLPYYFAKQLRAELNVPIAIVECAWGGQPIEGFVSEQGLSTFPQGQEAVDFKNATFAIYDQYLIDLAAWEANPVGPQPQPPGDDPRLEANLAGQIFNGMVSPLAGYGVRGMLFYQGEANSFGFSSPDYREFFEALVADWRNAWNEELPFYYFQLANFVSELRPQWVNVQNEQREALSNLTKSGIVIGNDIGNPDDIHPANKSDFAARAVRWPLANEYGQDIPLVTGPLFREAIREGSNVRVEFDYSSGLTTRNSQNPSSFELRENDGPWLSANAVLSGDSIIVSSPSIANPSEVRYAWDPNPINANLVNAAGLPASVFVATPVEGPPPPPNISLSISASPTPEGFVELPVTFSLSSPARGGESFSFSLQDGTAVLFEDFNPATNTFVTFGPGETSQTRLITLMEDSIPEPDETFELSVFNLNQLSASSTSITLEILDDDEEEPQPEPSLAINFTPIFEGQLVLQVDFELSAPATGTEGFSFNTSDGSAVANEDYVPFENGRVDFLAGETNKSIFLTFVDDSLEEADEFFNLILSELDGITSSNLSIEIPILNDDETVEPPVEIFLSISANPTPEGAIELPVTFDLSAPAQGGESFSFSLQNGSALLFEDFNPAQNTLVTFGPGETSQTRLVTLIEDSIAEPDENFELSVFDLSGLSAPNPNITLEILNDDESEPEPEPEPSLAVSFEPIFEGQLVLQVDFELSAPASGTESFSFTTTDGSAIANEDYIPFENGRVDFFAGETNKSIFLTFVDDSIVEADEAFNLVLSDLDGITSSNLSIEIPILNDDEVAQPAPSLSVSFEPIFEGQLVLQVDFELSAPANGTESFSFTTADGSAIANEDYVPFENGRVDFFAGETNKSIFLTFVDDSVVEADEAFNLVLSELTGITSANLSIEIPILNDDDGTTPEPEPETEPSLVVNFEPIFEGQQVLQINFDLSAPANGTESFSFTTSDGSAIADEDYVPFENGRIDFLAGETRQTIYLTFVNDSIVEADEFLNLVLSDLDGITRSNLSIEIPILNDDDQSTPPNPDPILTIVAEPVNEGLVGYPVTVNLSSPALGGERFDFALVSINDDSANPFEDFMPWENGRLVFSPGQTSVTLTFTLVDDAFVEPDETFTLALSNPVGIELASNNIPLTIINDDSVLDDFGSRFGLEVEQRRIDSDDDHDGIALFLEYAFNLNPLIAETPAYVAGNASPLNNEPFGMPRITSEVDPASGEKIITYVYIRRTDAYPKVEYITEISDDGMNFVSTEPDVVTPLTNFWEEVKVIIGGPTKPNINRCFARVRVIANDLNGDGF